MGSAARWLQLLKAVAWADTAVSLQWLLHISLWKCCWFSTRHLIEILRHLVLISEGSSPCLGCFFSQSWCGLLWRLSIYSFLFSTPKEREASLWFSVETAQHKETTLPIWIPGSLDLLKNQTTLLSFNTFTRKVTWCHCWLLPRYLKNATVPGDLLSLW